MLSIIDLAEYENLQSDLVKWAKEEGLSFKESDNIRGQVEKYPNDIRFQLIRFYSIDRRFSFYLSTEDIEMIEDKRIENTSYWPVVEFWASEEIPEEDIDDTTGDYDYDFDMIELSDIDISKVKKMISSQPAWPFFKEKIKK